MKRRLRMFLIALTSAATPLVTEITCDPNTGVLDVYRDDDAYYYDGGFYYDGIVIYDDCFLFVCF